MDQELCDTYGSRIKQRADAVREALRGYTGNVWAPAPPLDRGDGPSGLVYPPRRD